MRFEDSPSEEYDHRLHFEDGEVETVGAAYREAIFRKSAEGSVDKIPAYFFNVARWRKEKDNSYIDTSNPNVVAELLEEFHARTADAVADIPMVTAEPPFDNEDIARRVQLGEQALQLAKLIRGNQDAEMLVQLLDEQGPGLFTGGDGSSQLASG